ncbi:MAG: type I DNA topoisomerase [Lachnospiraceae bacterium]|nr:type I DNA topoisomerase [Lachnospiraceae bacterium]
MVKHLVIVESPAKVKTIKKFLGANYDVAASGGHVRDLPKSSLGIDVEHDYEPKYITIRGKGEVLADLRKRVKKADKIYLATDPDREGEAIAWHLYFALKLQDKKVYRISFNEITKNAVKEALKSPREIDMDLVDSQQVRRVLDRLVGYTISPLLWAKVKRGLSAGRVQSVALRLLCDREEAIHAFVAEEYWSLEADLKCEGERKAIPFKYYGEEGKKAEIHNREEMERILTDLEGKSFRVAEIRKGERSRKAPLPFTTSTLQQEASKVLNFSTGKTMRIAQQLYEGVEVKENGTVGIITYLRTDSTRVSEYAAQMVKDYIIEKHGEVYVGNISSGDKNKKNVQDAHEAIRPTHVAWTPAFLKDSLSRDQFRLYQLIWKRFVASAMKNARFDTLSVKADAGKHRFTAAASVMSFDGFLTVYDDGEEEKTKVRLDKITENSLLIWEAYRPEQHFTQPEPHFTEASLVRMLEERGIGRPSTYAPTIMTLLARRYVVKEEKNLYVTELGEVVNQMMKQSFPSIVDVDFTVNMETLLDSVEEGEISWKTIVRNFYPDLDEAVRKAEEDLAKVQIADELSDEFCEHCGRQMVIKYGPYGKFLACPGFPECKNTKPYLEKIGIKCPKCGGEILLKRTKKGRRYYGCEHNPECDYMIWRKPEADEKGVAKAAENL